MLQLPAPFVGAVSEAHRLAQFEGSQQRITDDKEATTYVSKVLNSIDRAPV